MSHFKFKKRQHHPVNFKKVECHPVKLKKKVRSLVINFLVKCPLPVIEDQKDLCHPVDVKGQGP